ncbi:alpha/beta hydrolase [Sphingomonas paeninsulae]|uniref:Alpha/beta hydrolase n=2 Tax=Sphingomonas paeninsulae TaxID=2319844 RepID=A0A494TLZ7_SPHPE|nr:alpha/beta hydrolase [Sphingomonas paeninsulae]
MQAASIRDYTVRDGLKLFATHYGPEQGAPVLLLHGGGQARGSWAQSGEALAREGFRAIALDMRGHGDSDWSRDGRYALDAFADDLREVIATLDRPPVLIGASLGGLASLLAVGEVPEAPAAAVVLVDIVPWMEKRGGEQVVDFMRGTSGGFDTIEEAADAVSGYLPHRPRPERLDGLSRNLRKKVDGRWYWHWDPNFVRPQEGWDMDKINERLSDAAQAIRAPLMLLHGTNSEIVSAEGASRFRALLPDAEVAPIAGAHHMVVGDDNNAFLGAIVPFLRRVQPMAVA